MIDIMLMEDPAMLRESLAASLDAQPDMRVVSQISDAAQAPEEARRLKPGLVLMDVCTENDSSGIVAARHARRLLDVPRARRLGLLGGERPHRGGDPDPAAGVRGEDPAGDRRRALPL